MFVTLYWILDGCVTEVNAYVKYNLFNAPASNDKGSFTTAEGERESENFLLMFEFFL